MANRFPLIVDSSTSTIQELPSGDSLDLTGGGIVNATQIDIVSEGDLRLQDASGGQYVALDAPATVGSSYTLTLPAADGSSGQAITTDGSGALSFTSVGTADGSITTAKLADDAVTAAKIADSVSLGAYNAWSVKTGNYTAVAKDQLIVNSSSGVTITLPASASTGDTVIIKATGGGTVTVGRNSQNINSVAADATIFSGNAAQLVYVDSTIGFLEI
jgi:hypothetical protein